MRSFLMKLQKYFPYRWRNLLFPVLIFVLTAYLSFKNYLPGTWLSGWDTLHPEFDFRLNIGRLVEGVWREEQGLGAVAGHAHMADLPRVLFLWLMSLFLPVSFLRWAYVFLCLFLGPMGVYVFLQRIVFEGSRRKFGRLAAFLGAIFYLLNLGTLQHFYLPFEMFPTQFAFLGWAFWLATEAFQKKGAKKWLFWLALANFLASPMAYAPQLWYVYFLSLFFYFFGLVLVGKERKLIRRGGLILGTVLVVNLFWLLPNFYFLLTGASGVAQAKINRLFSEEAFWRTKLLVPSKR